jgi:hypothetical protein
MADAPQPELERLGEVLAAYLEAEDAGWAPPRHAFLTRYPGLAANLVDFFASQDHVARLAGSAPNGARPPAGPQANELSFGDYEVIEGDSEWRHGRRLQGVAEGSGPVRGSQDDPRRSGGVPGGGAALRLLGRGQTGDRAEAGELLRFARAAAERLRIPEARQIQEIQRDHGFAEE